MPVLVQNIIVACQLLTQSTLCILIALTSSSNCNRASVLSYGTPKAVESADLAEFASFAHGNVVAIMHHTIIACHLHM